MSSCFFSNYASRSWVSGGIAFGGATLLSASILTERFSRLDKAACLLIASTVIAKNIVTLSCYENGFISGRKGYVATQLIGTGIATAIAYSVLQIKADGALICTLSIAISEMALTILSTRSGAHQEVDAANKRRWRATQLLCTSTLLAAIAPIAYSRFKAEGSSLKDPVIYAASLIASLFAATLFRYLYIPSQQILADLYQFATNSAENTFKVGLFFGKSLINALLKNSRFKNAEPERLMHSLIFVLIAVIYRDEKYGFLVVSKLEKNKKIYFSIEKNYFIFNGVDYPNIESVADAADKYREANAPVVLSEIGSIEVLQENIQELSELANLLDSDALKTAVAHFKKSPSENSAKDLLSVKVRAALHPDRHVKNPKLQKSCQEMLTTLNSISI